MSQNYIFVSYTARGRDIAQLIEHELTIRGTRVWVDRTRISPGADWAHEVRQALQDAAGVLFVLSDESALQLHEINELRARRKTVFLVATSKKGKDIAGREFPNDIFIDLTDVESTIDVLDLERLRTEPRVARGITRLVEVVAKFGGALSPQSPDLPPEANAESEELAPPAKGYVFLSYAKPDSDFVSSLKNFLSERGYAYWDYADSDRDYHTQLFLELEEVIKQAVATISVLSPDWKKSRWAVREYFFSEEVGKPVFLVRVRDPGPTLATAGITFIDFVNANAAGFAKLERELERKGL